MDSAEFTPRQRLANLYTSHNGWLRHWLGRRLGNAADAADLAHDTFLRLLIRGQVPEPAQSRAHLTQIAKGLMIDLHRRRAIETAYLEALAHRPGQQAPSPEARAMAVETVVHLDLALSRVSARTRETFVLSQIEGLTYSAIAERLGVSVATVRKDMLKAAQACHQTLAPDEAQSPLETGSQQEIGPLPVPPGRPG